MGNLLVSLKLKNTVKDQLMKMKYALLKFTLYCVLVQGMCQFFQGTFPCGGGKGNVKRRSPSWFIAPNNFKSYAGCRVNEYIEPEFGTFHFH